MIRPLAAADAVPLAALYAADRDYLRRWDPARPGEFFTPAGQASAVDALLRAAAEGRIWAGVIVDEGRVAGRITLNNIQRGPLQSCVLGYWVAQPAGGRGLATRAVAAVQPVAFETLALHRIDAYARPDNPRSCRVLEKNGFRRVGMSYGHVHIDGRWRDDITFQKLAPWDDGVRERP